MGEAVGAVLTFAVGVGLSPLPTVAVILVLFSRRASVNGPLFLVGWVVGLTTLVTALTLLAGALDVGSGEVADDGVSWARLVVGALLGVASVRTFRKQPAEGEEAPVPAWMGRLDDLSPARALRLGLLLSLNPKNLALGFGAAAALAQLSPGAAEVVVGVAAFVVVGSALVAGAVAYSAFGGERSRHGLEAARAWLTANATTVMAVLYLLFSALLISAGLGVR